MVPSSTHRVESGRALARPSNSSAPPELGMRLPASGPGGSVGRVPAARWAVPLLTLAAAGLVPWTVWLTFTLPSRHVTQDYDVAWVGFDVMLVAAIASTISAAIHGSRWLAPCATATGTLLVCDAWFDVVTSSGGGERARALLEAAFVELPFAAVCAFIVYDAESFRRATIARYAATVLRLRGRSGRAQ